MRASLKCTRARDEVNLYRQFDPIPRFRNHLLQEQKASDAELDAIDAEINQEIRARH